MSDAQNDTRERDEYVKLQKKIEHASDFAEIHRILEDIDTITRRVHQEHDFTILESEDE